MSSKLRPPPEPEPEIPADLGYPPDRIVEVSDWREIVPGQLVELRDGQQGLVVKVDKTAGDSAAAVTFVRVTSPRGASVPLGLTVTLTPAEAASETESGPLHVLGAWYPPARIPSTERVLIEAIRRGFVTKRTCGVTWPLAATWQLSEQAAAQIEQYLFEVARTTGCAFPFHEITVAMRRMHLRISADSAALCDIVTDEVLGRYPRSDEEMLNMWARALSRAIHAADLTVPDPLDAVPTQKPGDQGP